MDNIEEVRESYAYQMYTTIFRCRLLLNKLPLPINASRYSSKLELEFRYRQIYVKLVMNTDFILDDKVVTVLFVRDYESPGSDVEIEGDLMEDSFFTQANTILDML